MWFNKKLSRQWSQRWELTNVDSITVKRNPTSDSEVSNKKFFDDELDKNTIVRFNQTLQNYLKVSVANDTYNLTKCNKRQITGATLLKALNNEGYLLQNWVINSNDKNGNDKIPKFIESTKTSSPTGDSGAHSLSPIGDSFMYIETSSINNGDNDFRKFERTDIIQISNITFFYSRF